MVTPPVMTLMVMMVAGLGVVSGFNIYTEHAQILSGPEKTHFGYNVALWSTKIGQKRLVIGAPLGKNSTAGNQTWPLGNIHVCEPLSDQCDPDPRLPNLLSDDTSTRAIDFGSIIRKQGIGFGETLYTANQPSSKLVACAPRYVKIMEHVYLQARGICYVLDDVFASPEIIYPFPRLLIKTIENRPTVRNFHTDPTYLIGWATVTGRFNGVTEMIATSSSLDVYGIFGYSLGVGDIDGDGTDDLLVGAPLAKGIEGAPDCGRVYIYYSPVNQYPPWASPLVLAGREPWGRFGQAVTSPGDLNQDGYDEVVVGSPFDGGGVVYVFNGAAQGLIAIPAQEIRASEFSPGIRGFGFSLDGGVDMDDNGYPDLIIGSPESDNAVFLRSSPVVSLEGFVMFDPSIVVLGKRSCTVITDDVVCFNLEFDLKYSSKTKFEYLPGSRTRQTCLYREPTDHTGRPRLDAPIEVDATASLKSHLVRLGTQSSKLEVPTILDQLNPVDLRAEARLTCADPTTCFSKPDLLLQTTAPTQLVIGDGALAVEVQLVVREDAAFAVKLFLVTPTHLVFVRVSGEDTIPACVKEPPQTLTSHELSALTCRFTSDLYKNKKFTEQDTNDILNGDTIDDQILDPTNTTPQATQEPPRRLRRREADDEGVLMNPIDDDNVTLRTDDDNDMKTCNVSSLKAGSSVSLSVSGYAVIATLKKMRNRSLGLESRMKAEVTYLYSQLTGNLVNVTDSTHVIIITPPLGFFKRKRAPKKDSEMLMKNDQRQTMMNDGKKEEQRNGEEED
ncbi:Integrin alpha-5-like [Homarus americanus]|uniref:Integrin alpha-5-like n=1 Tax=Homarus americanus TaxID=6706 RepID=A0A8J5MLE7_HOMAM|nr:Integrin alpha-5-like [Homarus americanus]